jgi:lipopolysaccharide biosynthesis regulator YciM
MGAAIVLLLVGFGALAAGVLIGRYYVPDDRQLRRTARHSRAYMRALSHLIARDHDTVVNELRGVVEENVEDVEPYFALGAMFRSKGEHERAIRVHQALAVRERDKKKLRQRAMYELGLDFRAAGMPRRATRAMEEVLLEEPSHEGALRALAALYEEQARFNEAAGLWARLGKRRNEDTTLREHHLLVAAAQAALARSDADSAKQLLKAAQRHHETAHFFAAAAELAAARGNHRGAKERLKQALVADPALAPHLLPGLIAAEQGLATAEAMRTKSEPLRDELEEEPALPATDDTKQLAESAGEPSGALVVAGSAPATAPSTALTPASEVRVKTPPQGVPLVPPARPPQTITERVLALLAEVEAEVGQRLELALIRAQLVPPADDKAREQLANELVTRFPDALAARVATARLALEKREAAKVEAALEVLVADHGALAWAMRGRWQCAHCGHRPGPFSWRCGQCRRWNTLRMETGVEPPPLPPRERRAAPRAPRPEALLGAAPDDSLPAATLDPGLTEDELARAGTRRSFLGRVGNWFSGAWRRERA